MSGICGIYKLDRMKTIEPGILESMNSVLRHRGKDATKVYTDKNFGIAIRQLQLISNLDIVELSHNEDKTIGVVLDGEIYNKQELIALLETRKHLFYSKSSSEVIVHLYEEYGDDFLTHLKGMFAFALIDVKNGALILARDRMGEKPLYFYQNNDEIIFSSELKALLQIKHIRKDINYEALNDFLTFNYIPSPKTIIKDIQKILPGYALWYRNGVIQFKQYWEYEFNINYKQSEQDIADYLFKLLKESIKMRLDSSDSIGAFLSGGIDSSAVVGISSQLLGKKLKTFSAGFQDQQYSELPYARIVAKHFNTEYHEVIVNPDMLKNTLDKLVWHYDEPFADSSAIPTYFACKLAREHARVVLTGDGPDQMLGGSRNYLLEKQRNLIPLPQSIKKVLFGKIVGNFSIPTGTTSQIEKVKRILKMETMSLSQRHALRKAYGFPEEAKSMLYSDNLKQILSNSYDSTELFVEYYRKCNATDSLSKMLYIDSKTFIPDDLMVKVDRSAMAFGLETRKPFLDYNFVNFTSTIPSELKLKGMGIFKEATQKYILKRSLSKILPKETLTKKKHGFEAPIALWFKRELRNYFSQILFDARTKSRGLFNYEYVEKLWNQHQSGLCDNSLQLWALTIFELWQRTYLNI
jgi:asparagine synthase (glutamine-hydrolysing)